MIYFYGGAFNPLTKAHQKIIDDIISKMDLKQDQLIIGITSYQDKTYSYSDSDRHTMVYNYMFNKYVPMMEKHIYIRWQVLYQYMRTYNYLHKLFPNDEICIVVGEDEWNDLNDKKWVHSDELLNEYKFEIIPRTDAISSTKVRELLDNNADYSQLEQYITKEVFDMIKK